MAVDTRPKIRTSMQMSQASVLALRQALQQSTSPVSSPLLPPCSVRHVHIQPNAGETTSDTRTSPVQQKKPIIDRSGQGGSCLKPPNSACVPTSVEFNDLALEGKYAAQRRRMSEHVADQKLHKQLLVQSPKSPNLPAKYPLSPRFVPFLEPITAEELDESGSSSNSQVLKDLSSIRRSSVKRTITHDWATLPPICPSTPSLRASQPLFSNYMQTTAPVLTSTHDLLRRKGVQRHQSQRYLRDLT